MPIKVPHIISWVILPDFYKIEFMLTGNITDTLPTALNLIGLNISYILMCRIAEMIHKPSKAFLCAVR